MDKLKFRRGGGVRGGGVKILIQSTVSTSEDFKMTLHRSDLHYNIEFSDRGTKILSIYLISETLKEKVATHCIFFLNPTFNH